VREFFEGAAATLGAGPAKFFAELYEQGVEFIKQSGQLQEPNPVLADADKPLSVVQLLKLLCRMSHHLMSRVFVLAPRIGRYFRNRHSKNQIRRSVGQTAVGSKENRSA
jgi:hypothetical protein